MDFYVDLYGYGWFKRIIGYGELILKLMKKVVMCMFKKMLWKV